MTSRLGYRATFLYVTQLGLLSLGACASPPDDGQSQEPAGEGDGSDSADEEKPDASKPRDAESSPEPVGKPDGSLHPHDASSGDAGAHADAASSSRDDAATPASSDAGPSGDAGEPSNEADPCEPGDGTVTAGTAAQTSGYAVVEYDVRPPNELIRLRTKLTVPPKSPPNGTIFLWPGIQPMPGGRNFNPTGNGVLQPVLTWGAACAPGGLNDYSSWWISGQYVNVSTSAAGPTACLGGEVMKVNSGDVLDLDIVLNGSKWSQITHDEMTQKTVNFDHDLKGQSQGRAIFDVELPTSAKPTTDVIFTSTVLTMSMPDPKACTAVYKGRNDYITKSRVSKDGLHCCIDKITLRANGVAATSMP